MNGLFSYSWLKQFGKFDETPEEFAERVSLSGPAVERIVPEGELLENVIVGRVETVSQHPNADRLRVAKTKIGKRKSVSIVCGGKNLEEGQWVVVALPGSRVLWHGEGDPVTIEETELRGVKSYGMIAAADEIGLDDAFPHEEREILDLGVAFESQDLEEGTPLKELLGLDSVIFDMEVTTNRVDAMGVIGMAREAAAILKRPFLWKPASFPKTTPSATIPVTVHTPELCPRYMAVRIDGVTVGPSSWWLKRRLMSAGLNSINNVVDITNLILLELAQPLHAFDAEKLASGGLHIRTAKRGESMVALDGESYALDETMLVVADEKETVAIAGIKGGLASGIGNDTTSVILEAATFDPVSIRRTARALGLQTDAQQRFEKGLSTEAPAYALARALKMIQAECGGTIASAVTDVRAVPYVPREFSVTHREVQSLIGVEFPQREMVEILKRLGFGVKTKGDTITATVPWWRDHDIESGRDLVEEIARVYGYANIPPVVPVGVAPRPVDAELVWEDRCRTLMKGAGFTEGYSYSFVSEHLLEMCGYDPAAMLRVQNAISTDHVVMRTTLLPSLLEIASQNRDLAEESRFFEVANVYFPQKRTQKSKHGALPLELPDEQLELGCVLTGMKEPWRHAKGVAEHLMSEMGIQNATWKRLSTEPFWHPGRTVQAFVGDVLVATVGEVNPKIARSFKLDRVGAVHLPLEELVRHMKLTRAYDSASTYPPVLRDLAILVHERVEYADIAREIREMDPLVTNVEWFDTYHGKGLPTSKKSLAVHLEFSSSERTLEGDEVEGVMEKIVLMLKEKFKAEVR